MTDYLANASDEIMGQRIFFSVGEPSGDLHASNLIQCLKRIDPTTRVRGFGGSKMIQAGLDLDFDLTSMAVVGITEVLPKLREFFRIADIAEGCFKALARAQRMAVEPDPRAGAAIPSTKGSL
jgi:lipid-A-disaccharide synthase